MSRKVIVIILALAFLSGSGFYIYSGYSNKSAPGTGSDDDKDFTLPKITQTHEGKNIAPVKIDYGSIPEIIAKIDGVPVNKEAYVRALVGFERNMKKIGKPISQQMLDRLKGSVIENIINTETLARQAQKDGVTIDSSKVEERFASMKGNFPDEKRFDQALAELGLTRDQLKKEIGKTMSVQALLQREILDAITITDEQVRDYYDLNQLEFETEEKVHCAHILLKVDKNATDEEKARTKAEIEGILEKIKQGSDFGELARANSKDKRSAEKGGDLGELSRRQLIPEVAKVVFTLEPGEVSGIVKSRFGYHILKVFKRIPQGIIPFDKARKKIKQRLRSKQAQSRIREYVNNLRKKMNVEKLI